MRDHTKLRAFTLADLLVMRIYAATGRFPREEQFGLTSQVRRAAVSVAANIVEGCARDSTGEYIHFLQIAYASARELEYLLSVAARLDFLEPQMAADMDLLAVETSKVLNGLIRALRHRQHAKG